MNSGVTKCRELLDQRLGRPHNTTPVNGRDRIPDFYNAEKRLVVEVKNVEKQSYTLQIKDYVQLAQDNGTILILYVRKNTVLTGPLQDAINQGLIELRYLPW